MAKQPRPTRAHTPPEASMPAGRQNLDLPDSLHGSPTGEEESLPLWYDQLVAKSNGIDPPASFISQEELDDCLNQTRGYRTSVLLAAIMHRCEKFKEDSPSGDRGWNQNIAISGNLTLAMRALWNMLGTRRLFGQRTKRHFEE